MYVLASYKKPRHAPHQSPWIRVRGVHKVFFSGGGGGGEEGANALMKWCLLC